MEVVLNARFMDRRITGVERYAGDVAARLGQRLHLRRPPRLWSGLAGHMWEQLSLPRQLHAGQLLWSPANTGPLAVRNQVVTIHDLSPIDHPEWFAPSFAAWYAWLLPRLARRVQGVITVSEFSRRRLLEMFRLPPEKVVAIPAGVDLEHFYPRSQAEISLARSHYGLPERYFLWVGTLEPRKNLPLLTEAWAQLQPNDQDVELILAGGKSSHFRRMPPLDGGAEARWLGYIPDADLPAIYSGALACILPSLYEGFGLPALEAMACAAPVLAARAAALPEVVGEAGLLFDPGDAGALSAAIERLMGDAGLRTALSIQGLERARQFDANLTASKVWNVLQSIPDK